MDDTKVVYKIIAETGWKEYKTFTSEDPTKALLLPELLEENIQKLEDYYQNIRFFKLYTTEERGSIQVKDYTYTNGKLDKEIDSWRDNEGYYSDRFRKIPLPRYVEVAEKVGIKVNPAYTTDDYEERLGEWNYFNKLNEARSVFHPNGPFWPVGDRPRPKPPVYHPETYEDIYEYKVVLCGEREYQDYLCVKDFQFHEGLKISEMKYTPDSKPYYGFIDEKGNVVIEHKYDTVGPFSEGLARVAIDKKFGYINKLGEEVIHCIYDYAEDFHNGYAKVARYDSGYGSRVRANLIDKWGRTLVPWNYNNVEIYEYDNAQYRAGNTSDMIYQLEYIEGCTPKNINISDFIRYCSEKQKWLDSCKEWADEETIKWKTQEMREAIQYKFGSKYVRLYDITKHEILNVIYIARQLKVTKEDGTVLYLDVNEEEEKQLESEKEDLKPNDENVVYKVIVDGRKYQTLETFRTDDPTKLLLIPELYAENMQRIKDYANNLQFREFLTLDIDKDKIEDSTYMFQDGRLGKLVYSESGDVKRHWKRNWYGFEGMPLLRTKKTKRVFDIIFWRSYIDIDEGLTPFEKKYNEYFYDVSDFEIHEGLAISKKYFSPYGDRSPGYGFVDENGNVVIGYKYDSAGPFSEGLARVARGKKFGYVNKSGEEVIPCIYDYAEDFHNGLAKVGIIVGNSENLRGKVGCINKQGELVMDCIYDDLKIYNGEGHWGCGLYLDHSFFSFDYGRDAGAELFRKKFILGSIQAVKSRTIENLDWERYIRFCANWQEWTGQFDENYFSNPKYSVSRHLDMKYRRDEIFGKVSLYDMVSNESYDVFSIEKQKKIIKEDGTVLYLDEGIEEENSLTRKLTK